jgi:hypothetical protein
MTYLQMVNSVLRRLRETEVSSVTDNAYSTMIGEFVNDAKRNVEDSYNWNALYDTLSATTTNDIFNYVLVGSGQRFRVIDVINEDDKIVLSEIPTSKMTQMFLFSPMKGVPFYYNFNGTDINGDTQVDVYPTPNGVYDIRFNIVKPQVELSGNADVVKVPHEPIIFLAYAKALAERGEDGGLASNEAAQMYRQSLADAIAIESGRYGEESQFYWV